MRGKSLNPIWQGTESPSKVQKGNLPQSRELNQLLLKPHLRLGSNTVLAQSAPWCVTQMSLWRSACSWPLPAACEANGKAPTDSNASTGNRGEEAFKTFPIICVVRKQFYLHRWFEQSIIMLWAHLFPGELQWLLEHKHNLPSHNKINTLQFNWMESFTQQ